MPHLPDRHTDHDASVIAAFAAGDLAGPELERATALVADCAACATLRDDLVAIATAVHALPAPRRTRDYRLTDAQAARLRPAGWRGALAAFAAPRFRLAAPLGTTMATLGVAGLLLASLPASVPLGAMSGPAKSEATDQTTLMQRSSDAPPANPAPVPSAAAASATADTAGEAGGNNLAGGSPSSVEPGSDGGDTGGAQPAETPSTRDVAALAVRAADETVTIVAGLLVVLGLALIALRWTARRLA